jgi:hypothetical protein
MPSNGRPLEEEEEEEERDIREDSNVTCMRFLNQFHSFTIKRNNWFP